MTEKNYKKYGSVTVAEGYTDYMREAFGVLNALARVPWGDEEAFIFRVKGKSRCCESDAFDERLGKSIAGARADMKGEEKTARLYARIAKELEDVAMKTRALEKEHQKKAECIREKITKMTR